MLDGMNRVALVTGGAERVGRAIVERLAREGYDIAFTYFHSERDAAGLCRSIARRHHRIPLAIQADFTDPQSAAGLIYESIRKRFRRLDLLVNNASAYRRGRLRDTTIKIMREVTAVHVQAPLLLCQQFERMLRKSRGHVVNMCDLLGERPWPEYLAYCAARQRWRT